MYCFCSMSLLLSANNNKDSDPPRDANVSFMSNPGNLGDSWYAY